MFSFKDMIKRQSGGWVLIYVAMLIGVGSILGGYLFDRIRSTQNLFGSGKAITTGRFAAESLIKGMVKLTEQHISQSSSINTTSLMSYIDTNLSQITPTGFTVDNYTAIVDPTVTVGPIPTGPFAGLQSQQQAVSYSVFVKDINRQQFVTNSYLEGRFSLVYPTQFSVFSTAQGGVLFGGTTPTVLNGRVHMQPFGVVGGFPSLIIRYLTTPGPAYNANLPITGVYTPTFTNWVLKVGTDNNDVTATSTNVKTYDSTASTGCTNCASSGQDWASYALTNWNGHIQDQYHNVKPFKLYGLTTPIVQNYTRAGSSYQNVAERYFVDPIHTDETDDNNRLKLAYLADIRIINGAWFVKDVSDPDNWPGIPVWSDHPGSYNPSSVVVDTDNEDLEMTIVDDIGQADIRNLWSTTTNDWGTSSHILYRCCSMY